MTIIIIAITCVLVLATLLPFWRNPHWIVRGWDFPRLQLATLALLLLPVQATTLDITQLYGQVLICLTLASLVWQLWWILPYTPLWRSEVKATSHCSPERSLSIFTTNVLTPNHNAEALLKLIKTHHPDILVTLESDQWWQDQLDTLQTDMPYTIKCPLDNLYGMHVYSRLPLQDTETAFLVGNNIPSMHAQVKLPSGDCIRIHFLHPTPPSPTENPESAERDAELVIVARSVADSDQPVIVTGDLNDVAWSPTTRKFRKLSGLLDPRVGRGMFNTFHAKYPFLRWPLDHLFHSHHFTVSTIKRSAYYGSDHFALYTELAFAPRESGNQEGLTADANEQAEARAMAEEQNVSKNDVPRPGE